MTQNFDSIVVGTKPDGAYRLLHTADWHLGKMLGEHSRVEEHQRFLAFLLKTIQENCVDALIIAGDVFDSANPPQTAVRQYYDFMSALFKAGNCSVVVVAGNHDSPSQLEAPRQVLKSLRVHVHGTLAEVPTDSLLPLPSADDPKVVIAAIPFLRDRDLRSGKWGQTAEEIRRDLVAGIARRYQEVNQAAEPWIQKGVPMVATGHLTVIGSSTSDSERDIHVGGQGAIGAECFPETFAYVALGHLHKPQACGKRDDVRYSGSPIPLSFSEANDKKEMRLLDFVQGQLVQQSALPIPLFRALVQIRCTQDALTSTLKAYVPPASELPAWIELVVENPALGEDLYEVVRDLTQGKDYEVICVIGKRTAPVGTGLTDQKEPETLGVLLGDPKAVFEHRLTAEFLSEVDRTELKLLFQQLLNLHAEQKREGMV